MLPSHRRNPCGRLSSAHLEGLGSHRAPTLRHTIRTRSCRDPHRRPPLGHHPLGWGRLSDPPHVPMRSAGVSAFRRRRDWPDALRDLRGPHPSDDRSRRWFRSAGSSRPCPGRPKFSCPLISTPSTLRRESIRDRTDRDAIARQLSHDRGERGAPAELHRVSCDTAASVSQACPGVCRGSGGASVTHQAKPKRHASGGTKQVLGGAGRT